MPSREELSEALKVALKAQKKTEVATLRLMLAAIKDKEIAARSEAGGGLTEPEILSLLGKMIRQRQESAASYDAASRPELAKAERDEIVVIERFLPTQMEESAILDAVGKVIGELGANSLKDMGKVMGVLKERYAGQMDFGRASCVVKKSLV